MRCIWARGDLLRALFSRWAYIARSLNCMMSRNNTHFMSICKLFPYSCFLLLMKWHDVQSLDRTLVNPGVIAVIWNLHRVPYMSVLAWSFLFLLFSGNLSNLFSLNSAFFLFFHSEQTMQKVISLISSPRSDYFLSMFVDEGIAAL